MELFPPDLVAATLRAAVPLALAAVLTALIGVDRQRLDKPAGIRTNIVVGVASAAFGMLSVEVVGADPSRIAAQVVSGIGFLGGGAIFASGAKPHGLTTAAALWSSSAVGLAVGLGHPAIAIALSAVTVAALWPLDRVIGVTIDPRAPHTRVLHVVVDDVTDLAAVRESVSGTNGVQLRNMTFTPLGQRIAAVLELHGRDRAIDAAAAAAERVSLFLAGSSEDRSG